MQRREVKVQRRTIQNARLVALGILSGRIILNFGISERLRAFRYPIFTEGVVEENCLSTVALFPMKKGEEATRSAALSQKAALQMPFAAMTPPVKK